MAKTKQVRFYKEYPVKKMRKDGSEIVLTMLSPNRGERGPQIRVTQLEWELHGTSRDFAADTPMSELRKLADKNVTDIN